jgi:hypothetical protein
LRHRRIKLLLQRSIFHLFQVPLQLFKFTLNVETEAFISLSFYRSH